MKRPNPAQKKMVYVIGVLERKLCVSRKFRRKLKTVAGIVCLCVMLSFYEGCAEVLAQANDEIEEGAPTLLTSGPPPPQPPDNPKEKFWVSWLQILAWLAAIVSCIIAVGTSVIAIRNAMKPKNGLAYHIRPR